MVTIPCESEKLHLPECDDEMTITENGEYEIGNVKVIVDVQEGA